MPRMVDPTPFIDQEFVAEALQGPGRATNPPAPVVSVAAMHWPSSSPPARGWTFDRPLGRVGVGVFGVSLAFPLVASVVPAADLPGWLGPLDVAVAAALLVVALAITSAARGRIGPAVRDVCYRAYRVLAALPLVLFVVFLIVGHRLAWDVPLPGLGWRYWLLVYVLRPGWRSGRVTPNAFELSWGAHGAGWPARRGAGLTVAWVAGGNGARFDAWHLGVSPAVGCSVRGARGPGGARQRPGGSGAPAAAAPASAAAGQIADRLRDDGGEYAADVDGGRLRRVRRNTASTWSYCTSRARRASPVRWWRARSTWHRGRQRWRWARASRAPTR